MGFIVKGVKSIVKGVASVVKGVVGVVSKVVGGVFGFLVGGSKKAPAASQPNNLNKSLDPEAARKIVFGRIAAPLDLRYWEVYGSQGQLFDEVVALACHRIHSVLEFYLENELAISAAGVVQTKFAGVLSRATRLGTIGQTALGVGSGTQWNAQSTFDGCPHMVLKWNPDEKKLPNGIPSRYTQVIEAALVYDPRRDSTVPGGSGTHRINDRSTWEYATLDGNGVPIGRNNALQALWYLLGWTVPTKDALGNVTGEALVGGRGVFPEDINLATFIAGANACEVAGYYTDMILSTEDDHTSNEDKITCDGLIGRLIDPGGLWSYYANVDDTANIAVELTDADILDGVAVNWNEYKGMSEQFNQIGGKFVNPSPTTLFQAFPYPLVRDAVYEANLGIKKRKPQDFAQVLDSGLAQRLARLKLNEGQYQGEFSAGFMARALRAQAWSVVRYTSERFGWVKLFRVWRHDISTDGGVGMLLKEIHASIWQAGTVAAALPTLAGTRYNPSQEIALTGLAAAQLTITGPGANPTIADAAVITWTAPPENVRRTEVRYKLVGTTYWETATPIMRGVNTVTIFPLVSGATYEIHARHISIHEVEGPWIAIAGNFIAGSTGNISYAGIQAAGGTADVNGGIRDSAAGSAIVARNNLLTSLGISLGINNQGTGATANNLTQLNTAEGTKLNGIAPGAASAGPIRPITGGGNITIIGNMWWRTSGAESSYGGGIVGERQSAGAFIEQDILKWNTWYGHIALANDPNTLVPAGQEITFETYYLSAGNQIVWAIYQGYLTLTSGNIFNGTVGLKSTFSLAYDKDTGTFVAYIEGKPVWSKTGYNKGMSLYPKAMAWYLNSYGEDLNHKGVRYGPYSTGSNQKFTSIGAANAVHVGGTLFSGPGSNYATLIRGEHLQDTAYACADMVTNAHEYTMICLDTTPTQGGYNEQELFVQYYAGPAAGGPQLAILRNGVEITGSPYLGALTGLLEVAFENGRYRVWAGGVEYGAGVAGMVGAANRLLHWPKWYAYTAGQVTSGMKYSTAVPGATKGADLNDNIVDSGAGFQTVPRNEIRTPLGIALGYYNQGWYGTQNFVDFEDNVRVTNKGRVSKLGLTGRIIDPFAYNTQAVLGPKSTTNLVPTYTVGGSDVTVNFSAHNRLVTGPSGPVTLSYGAMSAVWPFSSYWAAYIDDPNMSGVASPAVVLTANPDDLLYSGRYHVGSGFTPAANGTGGETGGGGGGGGGWDNCVAAYAWVETQDGWKIATEIKPGDMLRVLTEDKLDTRWEPCTKNFVARSLAVRFESYSGYMLDLSVTTLLTTKCGTIDLYAPDAEAYELPVWHNGQLKWEGVFVEHIGEIDVAHIHCSQNTYLAGNIVGEGILTHNPIGSYPKP